MTKYEKYIWSSSGLPPENNMIRIIETRSKVETIQEHGKKVRKANMDFKSTNESSNLLKQKHTSTKSIINS
jgi:hypothetical protein